MHIMTIFYPQIPGFEHISVYIYSKSPNNFAILPIFSNIIMDLLAQIHLLIHY